MIRIPFKLWSSWTAEERTAVLTHYENTGKNWYLDLTEDAPKHDRISDFEEYEGESSDRGTDYRGYGPADKMRLTSKA